MFYYLPQLITTLLCCLFATVGAAADHSIHIEWGYTPPSAPPLSAPFPFTVSDNTTPPGVSPEPETSGNHAFTFKWETTSSAKSYRVYLNNKLLCETEDPNASTITCNADLINGVMTFSMTEVSSLGIESSLSNLLLFDPTDYPTLFNLKQVEFTWEYPTEKNLAGLRVYQNNALLCATSNPATRQLTCMANLTSPFKHIDIHERRSSDNYGCVSTFK